jgi:hypothetical protein
VSFPLPLFKPFAHAAQVAKEVALKEEIATLRAKHEQELLRYDDTITKSQDQISALKRELDGQRARNEQLLREHSGFKDEIQNLHQDSVRIQL